jgi:hypothetical protein
MNKESVRIKEIMKELSEMSQMEKQTEVRLKYKPELLCVNKSVYIEI